MAGNRAQSLAGFEQGWQLRWQWRSKAEAHPLPPPQTLAPDAWLTLLREHAGLSLIADKPGRRHAEAHWRRGGLQLALSAPMEAGEGLRRVETPARVDRAGLKLVLAAGGHPGAVAEKRRRLSAAALCLEHLLASLGQAGAPFVVECGGGPAPFALALLASLRREGRPGRLLGLDQDLQALAQARSLAESMQIEAVFASKPLAAYTPRPQPDLVMAVHLCGEAMLAAVAMAIRGGAQVIFAVPCCAPAGSGLRAGLPAALAGADVLLAERFDSLGHMLLIVETLAGAGYAVETREVYLRPWRGMELAVTAYRKPPREK